MSEEIDDQENRLKKKLIGLALVLAVLTCAAGYLILMPGYYQNYAPEQPIPYSHRLHAGQYKIPCLYCHGSAEYSQFSAVPGVETCMNCHTLAKPDSPWIKQIKAAYDSNKPIAWVKVHVLPDFVFFNHQRHVNAGVICQDCHGPIETMERVYQFAPLNMGWCVNCHRNNNYLTESRKEWSVVKSTMEGKAPVGGALGKLSSALSQPDPHNADVSCSTCHR